MTTIKLPDWWDEWTYYDEESFSTKLKEGAPESVKKDWKAIEKLTSMIDDEGLYLES